MNEPSLIHTIQDSSHRQLDKNINDMLDRGVNVHLVNESVIVNYEPTSGNNNALMLSAKYTKYIKPATYLRLIEATATNNQGINTINTKGETALNLFASTDDMEDGNENQNDDVAEQVVSMLLANGADPNIGSGNYSKTPLYNTLTNGNMAISMALVNSPTLEVNNFHGGSTYLVEAVKQNMLEVVQILLERGADVNRKSPRTGETPLVAAVNIPTNIQYYPAEHKESFVRDREALIQLLLQRNADRSIRVGGIPAVQANNNEGIEAQNAIPGRTAHNIASNPDLPDYQKLRPEIIAQLLPPPPPPPANNNNNNNNNNNSNNNNYNPDAETLIHSNSHTNRSYNSNNSNRNNNLQGGKRKTKKTKKTKSKKSNKNRKKTRRSSK